MFFHGTLGQAHGLGDLGVFAAVNAIEQKDLPRTLGQRTQRRFDMAQIIARLQRGLRFATHTVRRLRHQAFAGTHPSAFTAQMVDGNVAGASKQIGAQLLDLHQRPAPETQEQVLHQIGRSCPATDATADQRLHLRTLRQEHLKKMCAVAGLSIALDFTGLGRVADHQFTTART
ncbi:hypothetical protein D3C86_1536610 [compost metagenome]